MHVQRLLVSLSRILRILSALEDSPSLGEKGSRSLTPPRRSVAMLPHPPARLGGNRTTRAPGRRPSSAGASHLLAPRPQRSASPGYTAQTSPERYPVCLRSGN